MVQFDIKTNGNKALLTITANSFVANRPVLDLVCVLDRSGSMAYQSKMELAKKTIQFILSQLDRNDRVAIVTFDSDVKTECQLLNVSTVHSTVVKSICPGTCTNLSGGLLEAIQILDGSPGKIMLITDGIANVGITSTHGILNALKNPPPIYTFGIGSDHDENMLRAISEINASGVYYYIESPDTLPANVGDCLGGLLSTVAQNLKVTINGKVQMIGDLYADETKHILLDYNKNTSVIYNYYDVNYEEYVGGKVERVSHNPTLVENEMIRLKYIEYLDKGTIESIKECLDYLRHVKPDSPYIEECTLVLKSLEQGDHKQAVSVSSNHRSQRGMSYPTPLKSKMLQNAHNYSV